MGAGARTSCSAPWLKSRRSISGISARSTPSMTGVEGRGGTHAAGPFSQREPACSGVGPARAPGQWQSATAASPAALGWASWRLPPETLCSPVCLPFVEPVAFCQTPSPYVGEGVARWFLYGQGFFWDRFVFYGFKDLLGATLVAQTAKNPPAMRETRVPSLGREDPLEEEMATHSSILASEIPWTEEPGGLQSRGVAKSRGRPSD